MSREQLAAELYFLRYAPIVEGQENGEWGCGAAIPGGSRASARLDPLESGSVARKGCHTTFVEFPAPRKLSGIGLEPLIVAQ